MTMTSTVYTYRGRNSDITCGDATKRALDRYLQARRERKRKAGADRG